VTSTSPACHDRLSPSAILQNLQHSTQSRLTHVLFLWPRQAKVSRRGNSAQSPNHFRLERMPRDDARRTPSACTIAHKIVWPSDFRASKFAFVRGRHSARRGFAAIPASISTNSNWPSVALSASRSLPPSSNAGGVIVAPTREIRPIVVSVTINQVSRTEDPHAARKIG
jgi:hypothetical protein